MAPIRTLTHKDEKGNPIGMPFTRSPILPSSLILLVDPDFSNPTRSRWERPLETIRRFQEQIDEDYKRRVTVAGQGELPTASCIILMELTTHVELASRRSSYYGDARGHPGNAGMNNRQSMPPRHASHDGYYGSRHMSPGHTYAENGWNQGQGYAPRSRHSRPQHEIGYGRQGPPQNVYPTPGYQQSRDTVNTHGSGGSYSEPYHSDPNSESSSFERRGSGKQPDLGEQYGFQGFGDNPEMGGFAAGRTFSNQDGSYQQQQQQLPPPPPPHAPNQMPQQQQWGNTDQRPNQRPVISLNSTPAANASAEKGGRPNVLTRVTTEKEKRGSWFKRRFSKN